MWLIYVAYQASSQCCYEGNFMLSRGPLEFPRRTLTAKLRERLDDVRTWAEEIIKDTISDVADNACKELADDYYACGIDPGIIYTSEVLVPEVVPPVVEVPVVEVPVVEVPEFVKKTIADLERRRDLAKTIEAKERIQKTIDELKEEYGIK